MTMAKNDYSPKYTHITQAHKRTIKLPELQLTSKKYALVYFKTHIHTNHSTHTAQHTRMHTNAQEAMHTAITLCCNNYNVHGCAHILI